MVTGSCHCQTVRFEITAEIRGFMHCHCHTCRKINGTLYGSSALVTRAGFSIVAGQDALTAYESSPGKRRCFCSRCGSHVYAYFDRDPQTILLRIGTLDADPGVRPTGHIWVSHKAPWYEIRDDLPRFDEGPDKR
jgi:hypothetical protein